MNKEPKIPVVTEKADKIFNGYTIDELKYQRALVLLQREFTQAKMVGIMHKFTNKNSSVYSTPDRSRLAFAKSGNIVGKLFKGLDYLDYAMLGLSVFNTGKKIFSFFRRRK